MMHQLQYVLLALVPAVSAWGALGHQMTGALAQSMLSPAAAKALNGLFDNRANLEKESTWADEIKGRVQWANTLHYIEGRVPPSKSCTPLSYTRDCPNDECVVGAIGNYTTRLGDCRASVDSRREAARFLVHFVGDLGQPLHAGSRERGGNNVSVRFDNRSGVKLHAVWDSSIVEKRLKTTFAGDRDAYLAHLKSLAASVDGQDDCLATGINGKACALSWAADSTDINCSSVWPAFDKDPRANFGGRYYEQNWPVMEQQLVKSGVRLAALLNKILSQCPATRRARADDAASSSQA